MQRHYVMYYEMSYGLNVEMHKQRVIRQTSSRVIGAILRMRTRARALYTAATQLGDVNSLSWKNIKMATRSSVMTRTSSRGYLRPSGHIRPGSADLKLFHDSDLKSFSPVEDERCLIVSLLRNCPTLIIDVRGLLSFSGKPPQRRDGGFEDRLEIGSDIGGLSPAWATFTPTAAVSFLPPETTSGGTRHMSRSAGNISRPEGKLP
ncbi:hypothetical protein BIW11_04746 [Tropilaelaps mercedesae]|uniref:Groucho/TLE N-terminal Q-rich domain-containing protein n=1 Tax=Tropilaelaps mercedesae TaxID=418985 RepID=A0A1V9X207_9ACAR|nr:hypothetical protein BIW11_04746 [Tropilaelaps mercedesae]